VVAHDQQVIPLATSQDHKRATMATRAQYRRMGAYSPAPVVTPRLPTSALCERLSSPRCAACAATPNPYTDSCYAGLMIAADGTPNDARIQLPVR